MNVSGSLSQNTTWSPGTVYVLQGTVTVNSGVTLTVQPGAIVKFAPAALLKVNGTLVSQGTAANNIYFTSVKDDSVGGDTNGDGSASTPVAGDYQGIRFGISSFGAIRHAVIRYGGASGLSSPLGAVKIVGGSVAIKESVIFRNLRGIHNDQGFFTLATSTVSENQSYGVYVSNANLCCWTITAAVTGTAFANNALGDGYFAGDMNFVNFGNSTSGTTTKGFLMSGNLAQSATWNPGVPFVVNSNLTVPAGKTLELKPGAIVKFKPNTRITVDGSLVAKGMNPIPPPPERIVPGAAPAPPQNAAPIKVFFTSYKDDAVGGDTNGDGNASVPGVADYQNIRFNAGSTGEFDTAVIRYGGAAIPIPYGAIRIFGGTVAVRQSEVTKSNYGIYQTGGSLAVATSTVRENLNYGIFALHTCCSSATTTITGSAFGDNATGDAFLGNNLRFSGNGNTTSGTTTAGFFRSGTLVGDEAWHPGVPFVVADQFSSTVTVPAGKTLTVLPGTIVKFGTNGAMSVSGSLVAGSAAAYPVYFTSFKDDLIGGDTNGDGSASAPAPQNYDGIRFQSGSSGSFTNAVVRYGGGGPCCSFGALDVQGGAVSVTGSEFAQNYSGIFQDQGTLTVASSTVRESASYGINVDNGVFIVVPPAATTTIVATAFSSNAAGDAYVSGPVHFAASGNTMSGTTTHGFWLDEVTLPSSVTWNPGVPYVIKASSVFSGVTVPAGRTLAVAPGTIVKFQFGQLVVNGTLTAAGTALDKIYFTSLKDDTVGGDTNANGNATIPAPNDYSRIAFNAGATGTFVHVVVRYGGYYFFPPGAVTATGGTVSVANSRIHLNGGGLRRENGGALTVTQSSVHDNVSSGLSSSNVTPNVNAINNWWGSPLGPFHATLNNAAGTGNSVSNYVDFIPWLPSDPN